MKKAVLLLVSLLLIPAYVHAIDLPFFKGDKDKAAEQSQEKKEKSTFIIHFKTGGTLPTDNYTVTSDNIVVMMPSGAIYLDRKMVDSIEEVVGPEEESIQTIQIQMPAETQKKTSNAGAGTTEESEAEAGGLTEPTDDNGHDERWWRTRVNQWRDRKADAEKRYADANANWSKYNGLLENAQATIPTKKQVQKLDEEGNPVFKNGVPVYETVEVQEPAVSDYDISRYQDMRGSARVDMDRAQADIDEADRMLNETLPDEARQAGAPPGWLR